MTVLVLASGFYEYIVYFIFSQCQLLRTAVEFFVMGLFYIHTVMESAPLSGLLLCLLVSFTGIPLSPELRFHIPAVAQTFYTSCALCFLMAEAFSSHFSLGQPEITILKFLCWFIRCRRGVGPCGLDNGFLLVGIH